MVSVIDVLQKPSAAWTVEDLRMLCEAQAEESNTLELKQDLQTPQGAKGWRASKTLHRSESRDLAKEVVALANSHGGRIIIGIVESDDHPKRAVSLSRPLPSVAELAERLRDAFAALVDRPIQGLAVHSLACDGDEDGYLVVEVPDSLRSPHGVGRPPECYWRRDSTSTPMEMTDLQNIFWEARAGRERIEAELQRARNRLSEYLADHPGLSYRFTAVSEKPLSLPRIASDLRNGKVAPHSMSSRGSRVADYPLWSLHEWRPQASGAQRDADPRANRGRSTRWVVNESGIVEVLGAVAGTPNENNEVSAFVSPYWFAGTATDLVALLAYVNQYIGGEASRWVIEMELLSTHTSDYASFNDGWSDYREVDLRRSTCTTPLPIDLSMHIAETFELLEDRIWASFGLEVHTRYPFSELSSLAE